MKARLRRKVVYKSAAREIRRRKIFEIVDRAMREITDLFIERFALRFKRKADEKAQGVSA